MTETMTDIRAARFPQEADTVRRLFRAYADSLGISLDFQDFEAELAGLPGDYAPPAGRLLLAWQGEEAVGCAALRSLEGDLCEMKRLYVTPQGRATGLGRALAIRICDEAREAGYRAIRLDTLPGMVAAQGLYRALGFRPIPAYTFNPVPGAIFMERELTDSG